MNKERGISPLLRQERGIQRYRALNKDCKFHLPLDFAWNKGQSDQFKCIANAQIVAKGGELIPRCLFDRKKSREKAVEFHGARLFHGPYSTLLIGMKLTANAKTWTLAEALSLSLRLSALHSILGF